MRPWWGGQGLERGRWSWWDREEEDDEYKDEEEDQDKYEDEDEDEKEHVCER